jgi:chromosome segregation ATPase
MAAMLESDEMDSLSMSHGLMQTGMVQRLFEMVRISNADLQSLGSVASLRVLLLRCHKALCERDDELAELRDRVRDSDAELALSHQRRNELSARCDALMAQAADEQQRVGAELAESMRERAVLTQRVSALELELEQVHVQLAQMTELAASREQALAGDASALVAMEERWKQACQERDESRSEATALRASVGRLDEQLRQLAERLGSSAVDCGNERQRAERLAAELTIANTRLATLDESVSARTRECDALQSQLSSALHERGTCACACACAGRMRWRARARARQRRAYRGCGGPAQSRPCASFRRCSASATGWRTRCARR